ncbi:hypothetical protein CN906_20635 [Bacillus toyonensis]|uniref:trypsin-like peptidase domain-containing protein n=1 Tax=Bacillus toyonensis TaxID=155322 RepID=UPI00030FA421|nr:trypsin-like peptidase domain-containing protein [Bacillus toyonensis]PEJ62409.1 hypothetical protein CN906_20635 [Bacillus toyonensis]PGB31881.1 hypothetical protein COM16_17105 [Bacillus toyonensis]PHG54320.1 hypothetical protein COI57_01555 [Bacillus toyonensis]PKR92800.1 hypothetical protein bcere0024_01020 [Bacillus cereus Rock4-18]
MTNLFKKAVGRVHCGEKDGSLFLISPHLAITALHVVKEALNTEEKVEIEIEFPALKKETCLYGEIVYPTTKGMGVLPDLALLELSQPILEITPISLASMNLNEGDSWKAFGYPSTREEVGQLFKGTVAQGSVESTPYFYDIDLFCSDPQLTDLDYVPQGASGSPIIMGHYVVGVLTDVMPGSTIGVVKLNYCEEILKDHGIEILELGEYPKYHKDIARLKEDTRIKLENSFEISSLKIGQEKVKIEREVVKVLHKEVEQGSIVVIGEPGSGKSGALVDLANVLVEEKRDVLFLPVDHLNAEGTGALKSDLGIEHDLVEVLDNWLNKRAGVLIIDALDAARTEKSSEILNRIISRVEKPNSRWKVIASIRKFDLRHNYNLRGLFNGPVIKKYQDQEFQDVRHIHIPNFDNDEILQVSSAVPDIAKLFEQANEMLIHMLSNPFNLKIMGELIGNGVKNSDLTPIRTQNELMDRYWSYRVIGNDRQRDGREYLLNKIVKKMVDTRKLRVNRSDIVEGNLSDILHGLLSANVLLELQHSQEFKPDGLVLSFGHNIIFDYAVERFLLRGKQNEIIDLLVNEPDLILVIRPSFVHHFTHIWLSNESRVSFWKLAFQIIEKKEVHEIAKIIAPLVAVQLGYEISEFNPLLMELTNQEEAYRRIAESTMIHIVGGLLTMNSEKFLEVQSLELWSLFLEAISQNLTNTNVYSFSVLLNKLCNEWKALSINQLKNVGLAARRLLIYVFDNDSDNDQLLRISIAGVCRTFSTSSKQSEVLLKKFISFERITEKGYKELPLLVKELPFIFLDAPTFVKEVYCSAFEHKENSKEITKLGTEQILSLQSNRQQDYEMCLFNLGEIYPEFLKCSPFEATITLIRVLEIYVSANHPSYRIYEDTFMFNGTIGNFKSDNSNLWDGELYSYKDALKMLNAFQKYMISIGKDKNKSELYRELVGIILANNKLAVIWRRLIICGKLCPETLGVEIQPLALALPILNSEETYKVIGEYLAVMFPILSLDSKEKIEGTILSISSLLPEEKKEISDIKTRRLLKYLPEKLLVTDNAKKLRESLRDEEKRSADVKLLGKVEEDCEVTNQLEVYGIFLTQTEEKDINNIRIPIEKFIKRHRDLEPSRQQVNAILPVLLELKGNLEKTKKESVDSTFYDLCWDNLTEAFSIIISNHKVIEREDTISLGKDVILKSALLENPLLNVAREKEFEKSISWGLPAPRIRAAEGIVNLISHKEFMDNNVESTIRNLCVDPVSAVRYNIVGKLNYLLENFEELMWELIEESTVQEKNFSVLYILIRCTFQSLLKRNRDRVAKLTHHIYLRVQEEENAQDIRKACMDIFLELFLWEKHIYSRSVILEIVENPLEKSIEITHLTFIVRNFLTIGSIHESNSIHEYVRKQSWEIINQITCNSLIIKEDLINIFEQKGELTSTEQEQLNLLTKIGNSICMNIYFASGADEKSRISILVKKRFLQESIILLELLADFSHPKVIHYILKTSEFLIPLDPPLIFECISKVVRVAQNGGYQFESLGVQLVVKLVERYLAEFPSAFSEGDKNRQNLLSILEIFVQAGWPDARKLTYKLDELFR